MKTIKNNLTAIMFLIFFVLPSLVSAADHTVNAEVRAFKPAIIYIQPGDTIHFTNINSHNAVSYLKPEGAEGFGEKGKLPGGSFSISPSTEGIYGYVCEPHIGFGMVGVVVVGDITADDIEVAKTKAKETLEGPFKRVIGKINKIKATK